MDKMTQLENGLYKEYVENNYHTEAVMVSAIQAQRFDLLEKLSRIASLQLVSGFITKEDQDLRDRIAKAIEKGVEL